MSSVSVGVGLSLSVAVADLKGALAAASRVVERRTTIPILAHVKLVAEGGRLSILATDLDLELRTVIPAEVTTPGTTTLPALLLNDIVKRIDERERLQVAPGEGGLFTLKAGRSKWQVQALPAEDFPDLAIGAFETSFTLSPANLKEIADRLSFAICTEETRYYLNGVYLHAPVIDGAAKLRAVATDGHRLARLTLDQPAGAAAMPGIIVPRKTVAELAKLAESFGKEGGTTATIEVSETKIRVAFGDTALTSKLIDGTYPDYSRVVPPEAQHTVTLPRAAFLEAVDRVTAVSSERGRAVKFAFGSDVAGELMTLTCVNPDAGRGEDEIGNIEIAGAPPECGFNARYVLDCLQALGGDRVVLGLNETGSPARLHAPDKADELLVVLMPMRV
ncbi:DNA polymerase III subunit beta [Kaistia geumhonensis]|uniref:Beta sliding clamp n=1 Tax=Kaistia geumhonensis TaxID=410839 RepID=A0ABU0M5Q5_9HYPH|nr:DNA polymerase III subunit beta [Kaistia geumhonensis]MCX5478485.1 DNA polymerase III subunit beta [Kaistia geumhonensis]MDQ0516297.1 DNA polymerase-3 subunit beta [Kaistia geumhonensis]